MVRECCFAGSSRSSPDYCSDSLPADNTIESGLLGESPAAPIVIQVQGSAGCGSSGWQDKCTARQQSAQNPVAARCRGPPPKWQQSTHHSTELAACRSLGETRSQTWLPTAQSAQSPVENVG